MKKTILLFLPFLLFLVGTFVSCEEVKEEGKYDNWQERNEAFVDSLKREAGEKCVATLDQAREMKVGTLYAIEVSTQGTTAGSQYIYCKKLTRNDEGRRPLYTESVSAYYYGTIITGDKFDGNFVGYGATDRGELNGAEKMPTAFDSPANFILIKVISGWTTVLQYMRTGERWIVYIPWSCAYGSGGEGSIPGYSTLTFDMILDSVK